MKRSFKLASCAGILIALCGAFVTGRSWADGIPATGALAYSGQLDDSNGDPLTGSYNLELKLWSAARGGSALCSSSSQSVMLERGRFTLALPDACTDAVRINANTWIEILVDGSSLGRTKAGAVPYAVEASHATAADVATRADALGTLAPGDVQRRVADGCSDDQAIRAIAEDGTVTCENDDDTTYTGTNGVSVTGTAISADTSYVQRRSSALSTACNGANQSIKSIGADGAVTCELDDNATYSAATGLVPAGMIGIFASSCPSGWVICNGSGACPNLVGAYVKGGNAFVAQDGENSHTHGAGSYFAQLSWGENRLFANFAPASWTADWRTLEGLPGSNAGSFQQVEAPLVGGTSASSSHEPRRATVVFCMKS
jgi:hypothetical protein